MIQFRFILLVGLSLLSLACSTYHIKISEPMAMVERGQYQQAAQKIEPHAYTPGQDQLAYLLEYALIKQLEGDYVKSNEAFHLADRISEVKDYVSISDQAASIVFSESMVAYQGDDYEKMLINIFSALNYASLNNYESALVEIRRLNEKLEAYRDKTGRDYIDNPFTYYLGAIMWEKQKKYDDACIDYKKAYELLPHLSYLKDDLLYCSYKARRWEDLDRWKKEFQVESYGRKQAKLRDAKSEILVVVHQGWGPLKRPNPAWHRVPTLVPRSNRIRAIQVRRGEQVQRSEVAANIQHLSMDSLQKQYAGLLAKRIAARIAKEQIARRLDREDEGLGLLARVIMDVSDQADLRQWTSLPETLQIIRIPVDKGEHQLEVDFLDSFGDVTQSIPVTVNVGERELEVLFVKSVN
jgi:hypothetical protein